MSLHVEQFKALYKKDWLIRRRHWVVTLFELFLPVLMVWILLKTLPDRKDKSGINPPPQGETIESETLSNVMSNILGTSTRYFECDLYGQLFYYSPNTSEVNLFMEYLGQTCRARTHGFPNETALSQTWGETIDQNPYVVVFDYFNLTTHRVNYTIKPQTLSYTGPWSFSIDLHEESLIKMQSIINLGLAGFSQKKDRFFYEYEYSGQLFKEGNPSDQNEISAPTYLKGNKPNTFHFYLVYFFMEVSSLFMVCIMTRRIVREKATNSKEFLRIMGMTDIIYWSSHFINYFTISIFHAITITSLFTIFPDRNPFTNWNISLFFISYLLVSISTIMFTFALSTVINRPVIGVLIAITARAGFAYFPVASKTSQFQFFWIPAKGLSCLLPNGGLYWSMFDLMTLGEANKADWLNIFTKIDGSETIELGFVFLLMIVSWHLYAVLIWYLDAVWPWQSGTRKSWFFPFKKFFPKTSDETQVIDLETSNSSGLNESIAFGSQASIRCINLHRSFGSFGAKKYAVDGLNLDIMKGQITVLLGHNGAGKTTLMNMITGILPPTSGTILVNSINVSRNVSAARHCIALCPQSDLLFEELTVRENLELCAGLRELNSSIKAELIPLNISRVGLLAKTDTLASSLSGGMRRRLQLALALTTPASILILDEPTSGLDPESRRQLWDVLLELRKKLTILLTTHFMEEADALGDRIVIMSSGKVGCSGSPMFLKNRLGAGYLATIAKDHEHFNPDAVESTIKLFFPNAIIIGENTEDVIFRLDKGEFNLTKNCLPDLCDCLDTQKEQLGIKTYGISVSTLEDVFLRVSLGEDTFSSNKPLIKLNENDSMFNINQILDYKTLTGCALTFQRFKGLIFKRFHYVKRHYKLLLFTYVLPILAVIFTFVISQSGMRIVDDVASGYPYPLKLDAKSIYGDVIKAVIRKKENDSSQFLDTYVKINRDVGIETEIIDYEETMDQYFAKSGEDREEFMSKYLFGLIYEENKYTLWFNPQSALGLHFSIDAYSNAKISISSHNSSEARAETTIKSMPNGNKFGPMTKPMIGRAIVSVFIPLGLCSLAGSYFLFPSTESNSKLNLIQRMNGIGPFLFWTSHYLFDIFYHSIAIILILIAMTYIDTFVFIDLNFFATVILILMLFGLASIPLAYLLTFLPISPDGGFALIVVISVIGTLVSSVMYFIFDAMFHIKSWITTAGLLFPPYATTSALGVIYSEAIRIRECRKISACVLGNKDTTPVCCTKSGDYKLYDPMNEENGVLSHIYMLALGALIYFTLLLFYDINFHKAGYLLEKLISLFVPVRDSAPPVDDDDVLAEKNYVNDELGKSEQTDTLLVHDLTKKYGKFCAVDKINFSVRPKECFGLLGVNGAGKTTTFKTLTGDLLVSSGDAFIHKISLLKNTRQFQQFISYCPQYDALLENLTPEETLALFARLRGMPENKITVNVNYLIQSTDLSKFAKTLNRDLSGGNKRKLSLSIASIAKPELMFLDEPTTGVDPASRRKIWSTLVHLRDTSGSSIILTSHSMDECESLCSRIGIMARGQLRCLGSALRLKEKFGQGFSLLVKLNTQVAVDFQKIDIIQNHIREIFPSSVLRDLHQNIMHYHITDNSSRWGDMLRKMEDAKTKFPIDDYTLTGTTLEQVFLSFAKKN